MQATMIITVITFFCEREGLEIKRRITQKHKAQRAPSIFSELRATTVRHNIIPQLLKLYKD